MKSLLRITYLSMVLMMPLTPIWAQTSWSVQNSGTTDHLIAVQFLDANNGFATGMNGTVIKTSDGGDTWSSVSVPADAPVTDLSFIDNNTGWVSLGDVNSSDNSGSIWKTTDGGATWSNQPYSSKRARLGISFNDPTTGWVCGARNGPMDVAKTTDGGATYSEQSNGSIFGWTYKIDAVSSTDVWTVGGAFFPSVTGLIIHSTNGGNSWNTQNTGTIPFTYDVEAVDDQVIYVTGDAGFVMGTKDGGNSWNTQTTGTKDPLWRLSFSDSVTGLVCGDNGTIISTDDGGASWSAESSGVSVKLNGIFMLDDITAWAVGDGGTLLKRALTVSNSDLQNDVISVRIHPNPASDIARVTLSEMPSINNMQFELYDVAGNRILVKDVNEIQFTLSVDQLSKGMFYYALKNNNVLLRGGKLFVQ